MHIFVMRTNGQMRLDISPVDLLMHVAVERAENEVETAGREAHMHSTLDEEEARMHSL